ncbi:hypothetical protein CBER1_10928 [Cercospora berteroae]|uniref:Uncharacterized protein n=1 Tax=Cercospora berteroae TaxID=357750 RepID=A0A2S6C9R3_9PEZI|nr:hypothetical protein CBER1_10928 [Cercospora berteroae]
MSQAGSASSEAEYSIASDDFDIYSIDSSEFDDDDDSGSYVDESAQDVHHAMQWSQAEQYFENLTKTDLLGGGRAIRFSTRSIRTIQAFCARQQISARNKPTPALLNSLLHALDAPRDASVRAWEAMGGKVLRAIDYHVSKNVQNQALREVPGSDRVWVCTWKEWSKRWLQHDWDGDVREPGDVEEHEMRVRPAVGLRHAMSASQLAAAAAALHRRAMAETEGDEKEEEGGNGHEVDSGDADDEESDDNDREEEWEA